MKDKLYGIFDAVTMIFSPLVESLFDHAEVLSARREVRKGRGVYRLHPAQRLYEVRVRRAQGIGSRSAGELVEMVSGELLR